MNEDRTITNLLAAAEIEPCGASDSRAAFEENSGREARPLPGVTVPDFIEHQPPSGSSRVISPPLAGAGDNNAPAEGFIPDRSGPFTRPASPPASVPFAVPARNFTATDDELKEANARKLVCEQFLSLTRDGPD